MKRLLSTTAFDLLIKVGKTKKHSHPFFVFLSLLVGFTACQVEEKTEVKRPPNFIVIFIDDMGYGDIEPFGAQLSKTPHLNRMAEEGMVFTSFYAMAPYCSPSRAALMTGCYPKRVGLAFGSWSTVLFPKDSHGLNPDEKTVAEILKDAGYITGCFGKWHLGDQPVFLPNNHGFDDFFGIPYSNDMWPMNPRANTWKYPCPSLPLLRNGEVVDIVDDMEDQSTMCEDFTEEAIQFIHKNKDRPFFVYLPHAFIHHPRGARKEFLDRAGPIRVFEQDRLCGDYEYGMEQRTRATIEEVDWSAGRILKTIEELDLHENTMVVFTSDNGGASGSSNAPLRGAKGTTWEGGMREPTIFWWPGTIPANTVCDEIATTMDILPTLAVLGNGNVPDDRVIDGKNILPLITATSEAKSEYDALYYFMNNDIKAVRSREYKLTSGGQLYNLETDIGEMHDIAIQHPEIVIQMEELLNMGKLDLGDDENCRPPGIVDNPRYLVSIPKPGDK